MYENPTDPSGVIRNWMSNKNSFEFYSLWEELNNKNFKGVEFDTFKNEAGSNKFKISPQNGLKKPMQLVLYQNLEIMVVHLLIQILH